MWIAIKGARWSRGAGGSANYSRVFVANHNEGRTEASTQGYAIGDELEIDDILLYLDNIDVQSEEGLDVVTITWIGSRSSQSASGPERFADGYTHYNGETEWSVEMELDNVDAEKALAFDGSAWSASWGGDEADPLAQVPQPAMFLVQRKWMDKNTAGVGENPTTLPKTRANALKMVNAYQPNATIAVRALYEATAPTIMCLLDGTSSKFMCIDIRIEKDAEFVCRVARFKFKAKGWNANVFGPTWSPT